MFRALLLISLCGGLFHFGDITLRHIGLIGIYLFLVPLLFIELLQKKRLKIIPLCIAFGLLLLTLIGIVFSEKVIDQDLNRTYSLLYLTGFATFVLFAITNILYRMELNKILVSVSIVVISFATLNLFFIIYTPQPFLAISLLAGAPIENFSKLYDRILMPFGHPAQLGLVAACSAFALISFKQTFLIRLMIFLLFGVIFLTYANSIYIPVIVIFSLMYLKSVLKNPDLVWYFPISIYMAIFAVSLILLTEINVFGRDISNISESASRHFLLRLQTIEAISQFGFYDWLFGVGLGQSRFYIEGSYSFTVLLTQLLEGGILLLLIQLLYFASLAGYCKSNYSWRVWWLVFISALFYQVNNDISFYIYPLICIIAIEANNDQDTCKSS